MIKIEEKYLKKLLERRKKEEKELSEEHSGKEIKFTYWAGYRLGSIRTEISLIEDLIEILENFNISPKEKTKDKEDLEIYIKKINEKFPNVILLNGQKGEHRSASFINGGYVIFAKGVIEKDVESFLNFIFEEIQVPAIDLEKESPSVILIQ